jgi:hypothetical protein
MRVFSTATVAVSAIALLTTAPLSAQSSARGKLEGTLIERIASRSVAAAWISLLQAEGEASRTFLAHADARGRYHLDSLPAGRYLVQLSSAPLDSMDLTVPGGELTIAAGKTTHADFTLPYGAPLRKMICPGLTLGPGKTAVAGRATDADTEQPIVNAEVLAYWTEIAFEKDSLKTSIQRRTTKATTGDLGEYRLCGVPSGKLMWIQLQSGGHASALTRVMVTESQGAAVRHISLSPSTSPTLVALDSLERAARAASPDSASAGLQLTGTALLAGTVRSPTGQPLAGARVIVRDARSSAVTDSAGRFSIANLPSGTQVMLAQHLGYEQVEAVVELRAGKRVTHDVELARATLLDSVKVVAAKPALAEFEKNRRTNAMGRFLTRDDISRLSPKETSDLIRGLGGFDVRDRGAGARVVSNAVAIGKTCSSANVVIDDVEDQRINDIPPDQIGGLEVYKDGTSAPPKYANRADCGLIVIWMRPSTPGHGTATSAAAIKYNGYP